MKIGIEGQRLFRKKKHGMDMVALELIQNLQKIDDQNEYVVFVKPDEDSSCLTPSKNFKIVTLPSSLGYPGWEQLALPRAAKKEGCDLLHCTSNTAPVFSEIPLITTVHDIIYMEKFSLLQKGGSWYQKIGNLYRRVVVPWVVKSSKKIITVSNYEKERIANFFGLNDHKLTAIYNGVGTHFRKSLADPSKQAALQRYNLPQRFFFFLGNTDPKKNTKGVLQAFASFNAWYPNQYHLVMLDYEETVLGQLLDEIGNPALRSRIHLTGYVPNTELPAIISQAQIFLYPSLRESFGIPILEGMACGVPVITSNTSSMPEVAGQNNALIVNPHNAEEIANAMRLIVDDAALSKLLSENGINRAKEFSWENMAKQVLDLYKEVYQEIQKEKNDKR